MSHGDRRVRAAYPDASHAQFAAADAIPNKLRARTFIELIPASHRAQNKRGNVVRQSGQIRHEIVGAPPKVLEV